VTDWRMTDGLRQVAAVQLSAGVHVVRLQAPRRDAAGFRLDALLLASDDGAATAKLGLAGVHLGGGGGGGPPAAVLPGGPPPNVQPTAGGGQLPGVLIAGVPLGGAGLLLQQLAQQPSFVPHLDRLRPALHNALHEANHFHMKHAKESLEAYRDDFVRANGVKHTTCPGCVLPLDVAGEATATYSMCAQVPPRVHAQLPRAAIILVLRNEIDRAASHYSRCRYKGHAELGSFAETLRRETARIAKCDTDMTDMSQPQRRWAECYLPAAVCGGNPWGSACAGVIVSSMYDHVVGTWLEQLPPAQLLVLWQGALVAPRPLGTAPRVPAPGTPGVPRYQASMAAIAKHVGLPASATWAFAAPSPAAVEAATASEKFAAPLKDDTKALAALQALYQPHRDALLALLHAETRITTVWGEPGLGDPDVDAQMKTVSASRWQTKNR